MPSAKRVPQFAVLVICGAIGAGSLAGCETTQEKAAAQQAESKRILEARAKRQAQKKKHKHQQHGKHKKGEG
ncbi:MAG: hypothetical protein QOI84_1370 [Solirubrobacterales bacterium]|nr:hypothetical protein [Solirubrobacterales bacterium]